jgi:polysaccharide pyruvyl transferase WcaK-like protein
MGARGIVLFGYLGGGNLGDDLMLDGLLEVLKSTSRPITILARDPQAVSLPAGLTAKIYPASARAALKAALAGADFVRVGGTSFHDEYATRSMTGRYVKLAGLYLLPRVRGGASFAFGVGAGRMERASTRALASIAMKTCRAVYARDPASTRALKGLVPTANILDGVDLAFLRPHLVAGQDEALLGLSILDLAPYGKTAVEQDAFWEATARAALDAAPNVRRVRLFVFKDNEAESDRPVCERLARTLAARGLETEIIDQTPGRDAFLNALAECGYFLATRYHAGILAAASRTRLAVVSYNEKLDRLAQDFGIEPESVISPWRDPPETIRFSRPQPSADFERRKSGMATAIHDLLTGPHHD